MTRKLYSNEHAEQAVVIQWAKHRAWEHPELNYLFAIPNGAKLPYTYTNGKRWSPQAVLLKQEGMLAGVSDLFLPARRGGYAGLFVEMKYGKNNITDEQEKFLEAVNGFGYMGAVCWGADEAIKLISDYLEMPKV